MQGIRSHGCLWHVLIPSLSTCPIYPANWLEHCALLLWDRVLGVQYMLYPDSCMSVAIVMSSKFFVRYCAPESAPSCDKVFHNKCRQNMKYEHPWDAMFSVKYASHVRCNHSRHTTILKTILNGREPTNPRGSSQPQQLLSKLTVNTFFIDILDVVVFSRLTSSH